MSERLIIGLLAAAAVGVVLLGEGLNRRYWRNSFWRTALTRTVCIGLAGLGAVIALGETRPSRLMAMVVAAMIFGPLLTLRFWPFYQISRSRRSKS